MMMSKPNVAFTNFKRPTYGGFTLTKSGLKSPGIISMKEGGIVVEEEKPKKKNNYYQKN
jgi:hypothetical protein